MFRDLIERYSGDPKTLALVGSAVFLLLLLIILLAVRAARRRRVRHQQLDTELVAQERQAQFLASAEHLQFKADSAEVLRDIAGMFSGYLAMPLLAVYAGKESDHQFENILLGIQPAGSGTGTLAALPVAMPAAARREYQYPRVLPLSSFVSGQATDQSSAAGTVAGGRRIAVLPWKGQFQWAGLFVTRAGNETGQESLDRSAEAIAQIASKLCVALELESKQSQIRAADYRVGRLAQFYRPLLSHGSDRSAQALAPEIASLVGSDSAAIWKVDSDSGMVVMAAQYGLKGGESLPVPLGQGFVGRVAESGVPLAVTDAPNDPRCLFPSEARESGIGSYLGAPILVDGTVSGVAEVHTSQPHEWTQRDAVLLQIAADAIAATQMTVAAQPSLRAESAYLRLYEALQRLRTRDELMGASIEVLGHALGVSRAVIVEFAAAGTGGPTPSLPIKYEFREPDFPSALGLELPSDFAEGVRLDSTDSGAAVRNRSAEVSLLRPELVEQLDVKSELAVPVNVSGKTIGAICLHQCDKLREWETGDIEFAIRVANQLSLSLEQVQTLEAARREAQFAREEIRQLSEVNARAVGLLDSLPEPVVGLDHEGRVSFFNSAARVRLGLSNEDLGHMAELTEALAMMEETVWEQVSSCERITHFEGVLTSVRDEESPRSTGSLRPPTLSVSIAVSPVRNESGQITGRIVILSDISHVGAPASREVSASIAELEQRLGELERASMEARAEEARTRTLYERARAAEQEARAAAELAAVAESDARRERDQIREDEARARRSAQQLLDVNRLKSEFIVKAGRELETALQGLLAAAELLEQGALGLLTEEQLEAVRGICEWGDRMKSDVAWMVEYSSSRQPGVEIGPAHEAEQEIGEAQAE